MFEGMARSLPLAEELPLLLIRDRVAVLAYIDVKHSA